MFIKMLRLVFDWYGRMFPIKVPTIITKTIGWEIRRNDLFGLKRSGKK